MVYKVHSHNYVRRFRFFIVRIIPKDPETYIYKATFDGDSNYAPAESTVVVLTATST